MATGRKKGGRTPKKPKGSSGTVGRGGRSRKGGKSEGEKGKDKRRKVSTRFRKRIPTHGKLDLKRKRKTGRGIRQDGKQSPKPPRRRPKRPSRSKPRPKPRPVPPKVKKRRPKKPLLTPKKRPPLPPAPPKRPKRPKPTLPEFPRPKPTKPRRPRRPRGPKSIVVPVQLNDNAVEAESRIQGYLASALEYLARSEFNLVLDIKSFVNADGTVDGELRISTLPDEWAGEEGTVLLAAFFSELFRAIGTLVTGDENGQYFLSMGVRFGPQDDAEMGDLAEIYKRHRGLFQVAVYPTMASHHDGLQNNVAGLKAIIDSLQEKRGLDAAVILVRITWTPDGSRPERYEGERGTNVKKKVKPLPPS